MLPVSIGYYRGPRWMSEIRRLWLLLRHPHVRIEFHGPVYLGPGFSLHAPKGGTFIVGPAVEFRRNFRAELQDADSVITIGPRTVFTYDVLIQCGTRIDIGAECGLGQSTLIVDGNHKYRDLEKPPLFQGYEFRPITIGDGAVAWSKNTIIADLGERAILGSGAVVTKPVPAYTVAVGAPARPIDYYGPPGSEPEELKDSSSSSTMGATGVSDAPPES